MASDPTSPPVCLRLFLYPGVGNSYAAQLDLLIPANEALRLTTTDALEPTAEVAVQFPAEALRAAHADPAAYGTLLAQAVFAPEVLREGLQQAQQIATRMGCALQLEIALEHRVLSYVKSTGRGCAIRTSIWCSQCRCARMPLPICATRRTHPARRQRRLPYPIRNRLHLPMMPIP